MCNLKKGFDIWSLTIYINTQMPGYKSARFIEKALPIVCMVCMHAAYYNESFATKKYIIVLAQYMAVLK